MSSIFSRKGAYCEHPLLQDFCFNALKDKQKSQNKLMGKKKEKHNKKQPGHKTILSCTQLLNISMPASNKYQYRTCRKPGLPWALDVRQSNSSPQQNLKESKCDCVSHRYESKHHVPPRELGHPALHQILLGKAAVTADVIL